MKIVLAAMCVGRKNIVAVTKSMKAFIPNENLGSYQLPFQEKLMLSFSGNVHFQDSRYGTTSYIANKIGFLQLTWDKKIGNHDLLPELPPDTIITMTIRRQLQKRDQQPRENLVTRNFIQDEITFTEKQKLLLGMRYDYNSIHGSILTPRIAYKWN
jgi:outer membrane receptor for ferrienterochelin and colicins